MGITTMDVGLADHSGLTDKCHPKQEQYRGFTETSHNGSEKGCPVRFLLSFSFMLKGLVNNFIKIGPNLDQVSHDSLQPCVCCFPGFVSRKGLVRSM